MKSKLAGLAVWMMSFATGILLFAPACLAQSQPMATVSWLVTVPESTAASAQLFMAGNVSALGPWQPNAYRLERIDDRHFQGSLQLPVGTSLEYKFTRGSWGSVEKNIDGSEIANRTYTVVGDAKLEVEITAWGTAPRLKLNTGTGDLRWRNFHSKILAGERRITVWLPPQYRTDPQARFPVAYFLDGQNVFDASRAAFGTEWQADETGRALAEAESPFPVIMVAIDNSQNRMNEYTPSVHSLNGKQVGGEADQYLAFLCDELKPWIDTHFRTQSNAEQTTVIGSSLGGLFVLHAIKTRPAVVGNGIAMSPSLFWGDFSTLAAFRSWSPTLAPDTTLHLWIDMGTREGKSPAGNGELVDALKRLEASLRSSLPASVHVHTLIEENGEHNEAAWARRLPKAFQTVWLNSKATP